MNPYGQHGFCEAWIVRSTKAFGQGWASSTASRDPASQRGQLGSSRCKVDLCIIGRLLDGCELGCISVNSIYKCTPHPRCHWSRHSVAILGECYRTELINGTSVGLRMRNHRAPAIQGLSSVLSYHKNEPDVLSSQILHP